jgi:ribosomal-protein-alanine N-acetyltransferase
MQITDFSAVYLDDIVEIEKRSFARPWTQDMFLSSAANEHIYFKVAIDDESNALGYCIFWIVADETEILDIAITPQERGKAYGAALLETVIKISKEQGSQSIFLEVRQSNDTALKLYKSFGFEQVGIRKKYYIDEDAAIMRKKLELIV